MQFHFHQMFTVVEHDCIMGALSFMYMFLLLICGDYNSLLV